MRILEVIPFAKGMAADTLSYFTKDDVAPGTMVSVPVRGKKVQGLVIAAREAADEKSSLKTSPYSLRKIDKVLGPSALSETFLKSAARAAEFYSTTLGEMIAQTVPEVLLKAAPAERATRLKKPRAPARTEPQPGGLKSEKFILQREPEERLDYYRTHIRAEFAKGSSVFLMLPSAEEAEQFAEELSRGIERYTFILHGNLGKKELGKRLDALENEAHTVLIVGTPYFLPVPRADIDTLIVEHESSSVYRTLSRPYIDFRVFAEVLAYGMGARLILADTFLQVETLYREEIHELTELLPLKWRVRTREECLVIDTRKKEESKTESPKEFAFFSDDALDAIRSALARKGNILVYSSRRGLHPITTCSDCGTTLVCTRCSSPIVLHGRKSGDRVFICHKCKEELSAETPCAHCGSWKLTALGYGTESVHEALATLFPNAEIARLDRDAAKTPVRARHIAREFEKKKGAILIGSEMSLYYLSKPLDTVIVASIDSLFSIPSFRIQERIFHTLLALRTRSERSFIVQTRLEDTRVLRALAEGNLVDFYRAELADRKAYGYPPATRLIKLTIEGKKPALDQEAEAVQNLLSQFSPEVFSAFISKIKNLYRTHIVLRLPARQWSLPEFGEGTVDETLSAALRLLPRQIAVRIMPEDIL